MDVRPKLGITVDPQVYSRVFAAAVEDRVSVSAGMTQAARKALLVRDGLKPVAEWAQEHGPFTDVDLAAARRRVSAQLGRSDRVGSGRVGMTVLYDSGVLDAAYRSDL